MDDDSNQLDDGSIVKMVDPRPVLAHCARQVRSSIIAKINILQLLLVMYWLAVMLHMDYPRHNWTFILAGMTMIQSFGIASKPQLPGPSGSSGMTVMQMVFVLAVWVYAVHWSFTEARRVRKWQVECMEYYPINLSIGHDQLVLQSMITAPIISTCQFLIVLAFTLPSGFDIYHDYCRSKYDKLETDDTLG